MSDLLMMAEADPEIEALDASYQAARVATLPLFAFCAEASDLDAFQDRIAIRQDEIDRVVLSACEHEPARFAVVSHRLQEDWDANFGALIEHRAAVERAETVAEERQARVVRNERAARRAVERRAKKLAKDRKVPLADPNASKTAAARTAAKLVLRNNDGVVEVLFPDGDVVDYSLGDLLRDNTDLPGDAIDEMISDVSNADSTGVYSIEVPAGSTSFYASKTAATRTAVNEWDAYRALIDEKLGVTDPDQVAGDFERAIRSRFDSETGTFGLPDDFWDGDWFVDGVGQWRKRGYFGSKTAAQEPFPADACTFNDLDVGEFFTLPSHRDLCRKTGDGWCTLPTGRKVRMVGATQVNRADAPENAQVYDVVASVAATAGGFDWSVREGQSVLVCGSAKDRETAWGVADAARVALTTPPEFGTVEATLDYMRGWTDGVDNEVDQTNATRSYRQGAHDGLYWHVRAAGKPPWLDGDDDEEEGDDAPESSDAADADPAEDKGDEASTDSNTESDGETPGEEVDPNLVNQVDDQPQDDEEDGAPAEDMPESMDLSTLTVGDTVSMSYQMTDGSTGAVDVTLVAALDGDDGTVFHFDGPSGQFGVAVQDGKIVDSNGNEFSFSPTGTEEDLVGIESVEASILADHPHLSNDLVRRMARLIVWARDTAS